MKACSRESAGSRPPRRGAAVHGDGGNPGLGSIRRAWTTSLRAEPAVLIRGSVSSELFGGGSAGVGGAAQEVGEELEIVVFVAGADLVYRGVHS